MKTDRRHELQTNVLADWIGKHAQQWQGQSKTILAVILLIVAAGIAGTFLIQDQAAKAQAGWNQFFMAAGARDPQALSSVALANPGTPAGAWASLAEGDLQLAQGIGDLYTNRDNAKKSFEAAERSYLAVDLPGTDSMLRQRAWFGLGQVYESTAELDKAKESYGRVAAAAPTSALGKEAQTRIDALSDESTQKWYNWFANQTPRPPTIPGMPGDLGLPGLPSDLENLSDRPDLSVPSFPPVDTTTDPAPSPDDSTKDDSAATDPTVEQEAPAEDAASDESTPAEESADEAAPSTEESAPAAEPEPSSSDAADDAPKPSSGEASE